MHVSGHRLRIQARYLCDIDFLCYSRYGFRAPHFYYFSLSPSQIYYSVLVRIRRDTTLRTLLMFSAAVGIALRHLT
jgi:hypothetical protein